MEQNKDFFIGTAMDRRELLKKSGMAVLAVGGVLQFLIACTEIKPKQRGSSSVPSAGELKDKAIDTVVT